MALADVGDEDTSDFTDDSFLRGTLEDDSPAATPTPSASAAPAAPSAPATPAPAATAAPAASAAAAPSAPAAPAAPSAPAAPEPAPAAPTAPAAPVDPVATWNAWRAEAEGQLAKGHFAMSKELVEEAQDDPAKFWSETFPHLVSKWYLDTVTASVNAVKQALPEYISGFVQQSTAEQRAEDEFFGSWKQLDKGKHLAQVTEIGRVWRAMNPKATKEDYIKQVGALAVMQLGLPLVPESAPAAPVAPQMRPHVPMAGGAPAGAPPAPNNGNIFSSRALDLSQYDEAE